MLQLAAVSLSAAGFEVHQAEDGRTAVELAQALKPSCVVLDVRMPIMDGIEACQVLRADPAMAGCTIIMLTANAGAVDKVEGFSAGADDYIVNPSPPETWSAGCGRPYAGMRAISTSPRLRLSRPAPSDPRRDPT